MHIFTEKFKKSHIFRSLLKELYTET